MLLFYLLIGLQCPTAPVSLLHKLEAVFMNVEMSDFYSCLQQAKWFICHSDFPVCKFDKIRKKWKIIPICRRSCISYRKIPSCQRLMFDLQVVYIDFKKYCERSDFLDTLFCFDQQNDATTDCLANFPSKCFHLNVLCLIVVDVENTVKDRFRNIII